jgi:hypothetical protein
LLPAAIYGAEFWTLDKYIAKRLAIFEKNVCGGIKVSENWRKRYNKELVQLVGDSDTL